MTMAALPSLPLKRTHAVNLVYKIPTDKFISTSDVSPHGEECFYTTEISVERQWDYPDIVPATWTICLMMSNCYAQGELSASISPKDPNLAQLGAVDVLRSPGAVPVEVRIRANAEGPYDVVVGVQGWSEADKSLKTLIKRSVTARRPYDHYDRFIHRLREGVDVFVTLTFHCEKACPRTDLQNLMASRTLTDCILVCEGQEFPAHRAILAAQSPVFAAMFQGEMKGKICRIDDIGRDVLEVMLKFSYGRTPLDGEGKLEELWMAADKYGMKELGAECERIMVLTVRADNAVKRFEFALEWKLKDLKMAAMKLIVHFNLKI